MPNNIPPPFLTSHSVTISTHRKIYTTACWNVTHGLTTFKAGQACQARTMGRVTYNIVPLPPPLTCSLPPTLPRPLLPRTYLASCLPCNRPNPSTVNVAPLRVLPNVFVKDTWAACSSFIRTMLPPSICGVVYSLSDLFCIIYTEHDIIYDVFIYLYMKANATSL